MENYDETYRMTRIRSHNETENKRDWLVKLTVTQLTVCFLFFIAVFAIDKYSPDNFLLLKEKFKVIMEKDMTAKEVVSAFKEYIYIIQPIEETEAETEAMGGEAVAVYDAGETATFAPFYVTNSIVLPVNGEITSPFGYRYHPLTKEFSLHSGIDIKADTGTPIKAAFSGTVAKVGYNSVRGNYIVMRHSAGTETYYLHCEEIIAPEGANIRQGETIALVGSTGWSTGPHLHFGIRINEKYCNPEWIL